MRQKRISNMNFKMLRAEAGEVLAKEANRLKLIEAIMICVTPLLLYNVLFISYEGIILPTVDPATNPLTAFFWDVGFWAFITLFTLLFSLPLSSGLVWMAADMEAGRESRLIDVFRAFSSVQNYWRSLKISFALLWRIGVLALVEGGIFTLFDLFTDSVGMSLLCTGIMILVFFLWLFFACFGFFRTYNLVQSIKRSPMQRRMQEYACSFAIFYWLRFLPWMLLSLATFCILLLADLLPRMLIAYFRLCRKLTEKIQSEEPENE